MQKFIYITGIFICFLSGSLFAQSENLVVNMLPQKVYDREADSMRYQELLAEYGNKKRLPPGFELQALVALSHYPALKHKKIKFKFKKSKIAHGSRPNIWSLINPFSKRSYLIVISKKLKPNLEQTMMKTMSYNAQIGVMGHELAHTISYIDISFLRIIGLGFKYGNYDFKVEFENATDQRTIDYGLGYQLKAWSEHVHDLHIADGRGDYYFSAEKIAEIISKHALYIK